MGRPAGSHPSHSACADDLHFSEQIVVEQTAHLELEGDY
jgi:hypothetical protein